MQGAIEQIGLTVTEGFNDVLRLETLGVPSVAIMSNHASHAQIEKIIGFSRGNTNVMFDTDARGDDGAQKAVWRLAVAGGKVRLVWSAASADREFENREVESVSCQDIRQLSLKT